MGKHSRANQESKERLRKRNRNIRIGVATSLGAVAASIGSFVVLSNGETESAQMQTSGELPPEVIDGKADYIDLYGCADESELVINVGDLSHEDPFVTPLGVTDGNTITISSDISDQQTLRSTAIHEVGHGCTVGLVMFENAYEDYTFGVPMTGSDGLKPYFQDGTYATELEEGVVEWLSEGVVDYRESTSDGYIASSALADSISALRGFDRQTLVDIHQESDLIGYVALVKGKQVDQVIATDIADVVLLYQNAFYEGIVPTAEELVFYLDFPTSVG